MLVCVDIQIVYKFDSVENALSRKRHDKVRRDKTRHSLKMMNVPAICNGDLNLGHITNNGARAVTSFSQTNICDLDLGPTMLKRHITQIMSYLIFV